MRLGDIRVIVCMPYSCLLYGIPYEMRRDVGQTPRHLLHRKGDYIDIPSDWIRLDDCNPEVKAWLDEQKAKSQGLPGYPYEWQEVI